jgi:hypothetical protein
LDCVLYPASFLLSTGTKTVLNERQVALKVVYQPCLALVFSEIAMILVCLSSSFHTSPRHPQGSLQRAHVELAFQICKPVKTTVSFYTLAYVFSYDLGAVREGQS